MDKKEQIKYINEWKKDTSKRIPLELKKEDYERMVIHAKNKGYEKVNTYLKDLIKKDMGEC